MALVQKWFFLPLLPFLVAAAGAYYDPGTPSGFVDDFAGLLSADEVGGLESKLSQFEQATGNEIVVVTIPGLQGDTIEGFAEKLFQEWGIGKEGKDNGALLLVAVEDRAVRIEVGYGLEGMLTDAQSSQIINRVIIPAFQKEDYNGGISQAVDLILPALGGEEGAAEMIEEATAHDLPREQIIMIAIGGLILALVVFYLIRQGKFKQFKNKTPWFLGGGGFSGRGGGGGFGGFGGGHSGGGGASGRW
jgi:uncharacterized protein